MSMLTLPETIAEILYCCLGEQYLGFVESSLFVAPYDALETSIFMTELDL